MIDIVFKAIFIIGFFDVILAGIFTAIMIMDIRKMRK